MSNNIWTVSWSREVSEIDLETTADIEADSATSAVKKFLFLMPEFNWEKQIIRAEKNHTYFLFIIESNLLRRI